MKLYVLPLEKACNAKCKWCITNYRNTVKREILELGNLEKILSGKSFDKIEITGGGEPMLHPKINEIIEMCSDKAVTIMYTNGTFLEKLSRSIRLKELCISVASYDLEKNKEIMGVFPDVNYALALGIPLKFSLLLHKSGINKRGDVLKYLDWASDRAEKVVVRQLFEHNESIYNKMLREEFVSSEKVFRELKIGDYILSKHGNPIFNYKNLEVEFEYRSCACETENPVLHADGRFHKGWTSEVLNDINRL